MGFLGDKVCLVVVGDMQVVILEEAGDDLPVGGRSINLGPHSKKKVGARRFYNRCIYNGRATILRILKDGRDTGRILSPIHFLNYKKIIFNMRRTEGENEILFIQGVERTGWFHELIHGEAPVEEIRHELL